MNIFADINFGDKINKFFKVLEINFAGAFFVHFSLHRESSKTNTFTFYGTAPDPADIELKKKYSCLRIFLLICVV